MFQNNLERRCSEHTRSQYVFALLELDNLSAHNSCKSRPACHTECDQQGAHSLSEEKRENDYNDHVGDTDDDLQNTHHDIIDDSPTETADSAINDTDDERYKCADASDCQRDTPSDPDTREYIAPKVVASENVLQGGPLIRHIIVLCIVFDRPEDRLEDAHQNDDQKDDEACHCDLVLPEAAHCVFPVRNALPRNFF